MSTTETTDTSGTDVGGAAASAGMPTPDPALRRLDPLVGTWKGQGRFVGSGEDDIVGTITFSWLPGGFFLKQDIDLEMGGHTRIRSIELIGHDAETGGFSSQVYTNMSPVPLPYTWDVQDDRITISVSYGPMDSTFRGELSEDGRTFSGGWRPNPGADPAINVPYDMTGTRVDSGGVAMDPKLSLELVPVPVDDIDRAKAFYVDRMGFAVDHDVEPATSVRVVQLTPPGSGCSILLSRGLPALADSAVGGLRGLHLVVEDIHRARTTLVERGVDVEDVTDLGGIFYAGITDPDGNTWTLQQMPEVP